MVISLPLVFSGTRDASDSRSWMPSCRNSNRSSGIGFGASAQALYDVGLEHLTPGIEWYGDFGKLNKFGDENSEKHYVGPVVTGELAEFADSDIGYTVGYYWGLTSASANNGARIALDYELHF